MAGEEALCGEAFVGYPVGLKPKCRGECEIYFAGLLIGELRRRTLENASGESMHGRSNTPDRFGPGEQRQRGQAHAQRVGRRSIRLATLASVERRPRAVFPSSTDHSCNPVCARSVTHLRAAAIHSLSSALEEGEGGSSSHPPLPALSDHLPPGCAADVRIARRFDGTKRERGRIPSW